MCFVFSVRNIIVWGQRGQKEAVVRGVVTPLVIYTSPAVEPRPTTFAFCLCTAVLAVWLYNGVRQSWKKTCFGRRLSTRIEGEHCNVVRSKLDHILRFGKVNRSRQCLVFSFRSLNHSYPLSFKKRLDYGVPIAGHGDEWEGEVVGMIQRQMSCSHVYTVVWIGLETPGGGGGGLSGQLLLLLKPNSLKLNPRNSSFPLHTAAICSVIF